MRSVIVTDVLLHPIFRNTGKGAAGKINSVSVSLVGFQDFHWSTSWAGVKYAFWKMDNAPTFTSCCECNLVNVFESMLLQMSRNVRWNDARLACQANKDMKKFVYNDTEWT